MKLRLTVFALLLMFSGCTHSGHFVFQYTAILPEGKNLRFYKTNDFTDGNPFNQLRYDTLENGFSTELYLHSLDSRKLIPGYYLRKDSLFLTIRSEKKLD